MVLISVRLEDTPVGYLPPRRPAPWYGHGPFQFSVSVMWVAPTRRGAIAEEGTQAVAPRELSRARARLFRIRKEKVCRLTNCCAFRYPDRACHRPVPPPAHGLLQRPGWGERRASSGIRRFSITTLSS